MEYIYFRYFNFISFRHFIISCVRARARVCLCVCVSNATILTKSCYLLSCIVYYFWFFLRKLFLYFIYKLRVLNIEDWTKYFIMLRHPSICPWTFLTFAHNSIYHDIRCFHNSFYHMLGTFSRTCIISTR